MKKRSRVLSLLLCVVLLLGLLPISAAAEDAVETVDSISDANRIIRGWSEHGSAGSYMLRFAKELTEEALTGRLLVLPMPDNAQLTIQGATEESMDNADKRTTIHGNAIVQGNVFFKDLNFAKAESVNGNSAIWNSLDDSGSGSNVDLLGCRISGYDQGIDAEDFRSLWMKDVEITNCESAGLHLGSFATDSDLLHLENVHISGSEYALYFLYGKPADEDWCDEDCSFEGTNKDIYAPETRNRNAVEDDLLSAHYDGEMEPAEFEYNMNTYYLGLAFYPYKDEIMLHGGISVKTGERLIQTLGAAFYTFDKDAGYVPVSPEIERELTAAFNGTLEFNIYVDALINERTGEPMQIPYSMRSKTGPCGSVILFDDGTEGIYDLTVTGILDDSTELATSAWLEIMRHEEYREDAETIEEANDILAGWAQNRSAVDRNVFFYLDLAKEKMSGNLLIPEFPMPEVTDVVVTGLPGDGTTINGSIESNVSCSFERIHVVGSGSENEYNEDDTRNVGCYGEGSAKFYNCSFSGLYIGVESTGHGLRFGSHNTVYQNCHYGLYVDNVDTNKGDIEIHDAKFIGNGEAIHIENFSTGFPAWYWKIKQSVFYDNARDVRNVSGQKLFMPGNYFHHATDTPKNPEKWSNNALLYPIAMDNTFSVLDYDWKAVEWGTVTVSNMLAAEYPIPADYLDGMSMDVYDPEADATIANISFEEPEEQPAPAPKRMLMKAAPMLLATEAFDATLERIDNPDGTISLTVNPAPEGKTPVITLKIPGVKNAEVTFDSNPIEPKVLENKISFPAEASGTYTVSFGTTKGSQTAPAAGEGFTVDYANDKIAPKEGYEIRTESGMFATKELSLRIGQPFYVRKSGTDTLNPSEGTENTIVERPTPTPVPTPSTFAKEEDVLPEEIKNQIFENGEMINGHKYFQPAEFQYDGNTYYLGIPKLRMGDRGEILDQDVHANHIGARYKPGGSSSYNAGVNFFTSTTSGQSKSYNPVDDTTRETLERAFGNTLKLTLYAEDIGMMLPTVSRRECKLSIANEYGYTSDMAGGYYFLVVTGTIGGRTITAVKSYEVELDTDPDNPVSTDTDVLPNELKAKIYTDGRSDLEKMQPVPFQYQGETYYLNVANLDRTTGMTELIHPGRQDVAGVDQTVCCACPEFFTYSSNFYPVTDAAIREGLLRAFGDTLTLQLYVDAEVDPETGKKVCLPLVEHVKDSNHPAAACYTFDIDTNGSYYFVVSGTIDGQTITSIVEHAYYNLTSFSQYVSSMEDANNVLARWANLKNVSENERVQYTLYFAPTTWENEDAMSGCLHIPKLPGDAFVKLEGYAYDNFRTTINGCIFNESSTIMENVDVVGCGKENAVWPEDLENAGLRNVGVYGNEGIQYTMCTFKDLYIGVEARDGGGFGSSNCKFINCGTGLDVNTEENRASGSEIRNAVFEGNDTAISIKKFGEGFPALYYFRILRTSFINNGTDIKNTSGNKFFVPGNYVYHEGDTSSQIEKYSINAYFYPVATGTDFKEFSYDWDNASYSNQLASEFPIPADNLDGKSIDLYESEDSSLIANISFEGQVLQAPKRMLMKSAPMLAAQPMLLATEAPVTAFDATLERVDNPDGTISLTVNPAPEGKTPIITIPIPSVENAEVTFGSDPVDSEILTDAIRFPAKNGGIYTISFKKAKGGQTAPAAGEGFTVDYANGKIAPKEGYEIRTESGTFAAQELPLRIGQPYYVRKAETGELYASGETKNTISKYSVTISADAESFTYGDSGKTGFKNLSVEDALFSSDELDYLYENTGSTAAYSSAEAPTAAGTYEVTISVPETSSYYIGSKTVEFSVLKKTVTVKAADLRAEVGDPVPQLTCTVSGLLSGDTLAAYSVSCDAPAEKGKLTRAGNYVITVLGSADAAGSNYTVSYQNGRLTVYDSAEDIGLLSFIADNSIMNYCSDVGEFDYYHDSVLWAYRNNICTGTDARHFSPNAPVTRAQVVTFLWRAAGKPMVNYAMNMTDVKPGEYYTEAVRWALAAGITKGTTDTTFSPDAVCTRGQIVTFLARFAGVVDANTQSVFSDVKSTDYYAAAVKWAKYNNVTEGMTATTFCPNAACTRAQVVTFLYRWMVK